MIRHFGIDAVTDFMELKLAASNSVLYPWRKALAQRMGISTPTLRRRIAKVIASGLATRGDRGYVHLRSFDDALIEANGGSLPQYKTTIKLEKNASRKEISFALRTKLLEEKHSQALYQQTNTEIRQAFIARYGDIHSTAIKRRLFKKEKLERGYVRKDVPFALETMAKAMGISRSQTIKYMKKLKARGLMTSVQNRAIVHRDGIPVVMSPKEFGIAHDDLCSAYGGKAVRRKNGEVFIVRPNLVSMVVGNAANRSRRMPV